MKKILWTLAALALFLPMGVHAADTLTVDNLDPGYVEISGTWTGSTSGYADSSRWCSLSTNPLATARWTPTMTTADKYNTYYYLPITTNSSTNAKYVIVHSAGRDSLYKDQNKGSQNWVFLGAYDFSVGTSGYVEVVNDTNAIPKPTGWAFRADAARWEAVGDTQDIHCVYDHHDFGIVPPDSTEDWIFDISNVGGDDLVVDSVVTNTAEFLITNPAFPQTLLPGATLDITVRFAPTAAGSYADSVEIFSDDPDEPRQVIDVVGTSGQLIVDNSDGFPAYQELLGSWATSTYGGYNGDHRYSYISSNPMATAQWTPTVPQADTFNVYFIIDIVGATFSAENAKYVIVHAAGRDSAYRNQDFQAGVYWTFLGQYPFDAGTSGYVQVVNDTSVETPGSVLRADVIKLEPPTPSQDLYVIDDSHDFGDVTVGNSADWTFRAHNIGAMNLNLDSIVTSDPSFTIPSPSTPAVIPPGGTQIITVRFSPMAQGEYSGENVKVFSDDGEAPPSVGLSGRGVGRLVIVDNADGAPWYTEDSDTSWADSYSGYLGLSRWSGSPTSPPRWAKWTPNITYADYYDVYWIIVSTDWTDQNALYEIHSSDGQVCSFRVNQQYCPDWTYLGSVYFDTDTSGYVVVINDSECTGPVVRADAIKFLQTAWPDTIPPNTVTDLDAEKSGDDVYLSWTPVCDNYTGVDYYIVFRNTSPYFTPTSGDSIGTTPDTVTSYVDINAVGMVGTNYYYAVQAVDKASPANKSAYSNQAGEFDRQTVNAK